ncbi:hypothetical protein HK101_009652 [Irineochytrium annulatum]|nr:hypothetical protein HK101_009652 [Irineochytrium annulatum]
MSGIVDRARALLTGVSGGLDGWRVARARMRLDGTVKVYGAREEHADGVGVKESIHIASSHDEIAPDNSVHLLLCVRFLARSHYPWMARAVRSGGFVLVYTFSAGCEAFGAPRDPNHILREGELDGVFGDAQGWEVLVDRVEALEDGRPVCAFLARKR